MGVISRRLEDASDGFLTMKFGLLGLDRYPFFSLALEFKNRLLRTIRLFHASLSYKSTFQRNILHQNFTKDISDNGIIGHDELDTNKA